MPLLNTARPIARIFNERRAVSRQRVLKGALLRFDRGFGSRECVVREISAGGARLKFGDAAGVPARFELRVGLEGGWRGVSVKWRRGNEIGVAFI